MSEEDIEKRWSVYKIEYSKSIIGIKDNDIVFVSDTGTSKTESVYIFVKYKTPSDRRKKDCKSIRIDITFQQFKREQKINSIIC